MSRKISPITREMIEKRKCCVCGKGTYRYTENRIQWHRDIDESGKWTGKWKCNNCHSKEYNRERNRQNDMRRKIILKMNKNMEMIRNEKNRSIEIIMGSQSPSDGIDNIDFGDVDHRNVLGTLE